MQLNVTISEIQSLATNGKVFAEGKAYANDEYINNLTFDAPERCLSANVKSMDHVSHYNVQIWLNNRERPRKVSCSCPNATKYLGCCKHQVAVMLFALNTRLDRLPTDTPGQTTTVINQKQAATGQKAEQKATAKSDEQKDGFIGEAKTPAAAITTPAQYTVDNRPQIKNHRQTLEMMRRLQTVLAIDRGASYEGNLFASEEDPEAAEGDRPRRGLLRQLDLRMNLQLPQYSSEMALLEAKIGFQGESRYYKVKSFDELIESIDNGKSLVFGKELTLHPDRQYFNAASQAVIDWLIFLYHNQMEKTAFQYQAVSTIFKKNQVVLNAARLYEFFNLYAHDAAGLDLSIDAYHGQAVSKEIEKSWPEVSFALRAWPRSERGQSAGSNSLTTATQIQRIQKVDLNASASEEDLNILQLFLISDEDRETLVRAYMANSYKRSGQDRPLRLLTRDASLLFFDGKIWMPPHEDRVIASLYRSLAEAEDGYLLLGNEEAGVFMSQMLPFLESKQHIALARDVQDALLREPLEASIWLDREGNGVSARISFRYGHYVIDPHPATTAGPIFSPQNDEEVQVDKGRWQLRDEDAELRILDYFSLSGFQDHQPAKVKVARRSGLLADLSSTLPATKKTEEHNLFYLFGDRKLYTFLSTALPQLQGLATIFYSDRFRNININRLGQISMSAGLGRKGDLLSISVEGMDYDAEDLARILEAYREKRSYVRLKDGEFLTFDTEFNDPTLDILAEAESWGGSWEDGQFVLPKFRAVPLQQLIAREDGASVEIDDDFGVLAANLKDPARLHFAHPTSVQATLRPYQIAGFQWLCLMDYYGFGGILADDMGLGKTLQALTYIQYKKESGDKKPVLVVAPTSLIYNWQDEAQKFTPGLNVQVVEGQKEARLQTLTEIDGVDILIMSYTVMRQDIDVLEDIDFSACFLDEAQYIKNPRTQTAKGTKKIRADRHFALTGTPIENSLAELWSIFDYLMPGYLFSLSKFHDQFELPIARADEDSTAASDELRMLVRPFILRRMKKNVLTELPDKIESIMRCDMTDEQAKVYMAYVSQARDSFEQLVENQGFERSQIQILALLTRLRQISCHPQLFLDNYEGGSGKLDALDEHLDNLLSSSHRILLFSQFTSMLDIIRKRQEERGRKIFYIDGQVAPKDRIEQVDRFNAGEGEIFLISLKAGGTGLNLTGADTVIHYDPWWNPAVEQQATDRAHRIGQREVVQIFRMVSRGTIEEKIIELQKQKSMLVDQVIQPGENFLKQMDLGEIRNLLSYEI